MKFYFHLCIQMSNQIQKYTKKNIYKENLDENIHKQIYIRIMLAKKEKLSLAFFYISVLNKR
jgi:hypothetical protein